MCHRMQHLKMMFRTITLLSKCNKINTETFSSELICRRYRATTKNFVYIARYEKGELEMIGGNSTLRVKGQFSEKIERKKGGDYVRTVGYTVDENGYKTFLLDLSTAVTTYKLVPAIIHLLGPPPPNGPKILISSTVLASLSGGNLG
jgi:hypothetical protein